MYPPWYSQVSGTARLDRESGTRTSNPTSIMGHWSWKCPGSPHLQQAGPGLTAAPAAEGWARDCRREYWGEVVGSGPPPLPGVTVALSLSELSIPTPWRGWRVAWRRRAGFLVPSFGTSVTRFEVQGRKDEEVRGDEPQKGCLITQNKTVTTKRKQSTGALLL